MKSLLALALLILAVAEANHAPEHFLRGPRFKPGRQYTYDLQLNVTAGVLGLSSQNSAAVLQAEVSIYAQTEKEHILKIDNVLSSDSVKAIDGKYGDINLKSNRDLQEKLSQPIKFTLEDGKVTSYTLSDRENLESKKIKKSILRSLEMYVPQSSLQELESSSYPSVTYNTSETTEYGIHSSHYTITVSPDVDFPSDWSVYNISRIDDFESERYPGQKFYHNYQKQGCPEVCKKDRTNSRYGAGCPSGHEPHQSPIKTSFSHEHSLSAYEDVLSPEVIRTVEVHFAEMYDQMMEVLIRYQLSRKDVSSERIEEPSRQQSYSDLKDWESESNETEIHDYCSERQRSRGPEAAAASDALLRQISQIIVDNKLEDPKSQLIGEKSVLLRDALSKLSEEEFEQLERQIKPVSSLNGAPAMEKVKRQIWIDVLPLVGTQESVKYIVKYITKGVPERSVMAWEAKEILESLPQNIEQPDSETIHQLLELTRNSQVLRNSPMLHSAAHLTVAKVAGEACGNRPTVRSQRKSSSWFGMFDDKSDNDQAPCPERLVSDLVEEISKKLRETQKPAEILVYIESLATIGTPDVLPLISEYVYGSAENIQELGSRFVTFTKSAATLALHNIAKRNPEQVLEIVSPVFFNETETPKVRNAAFGVLIRCNPSLAILEKIAIRSWVERSKEVGSFVTSTLETFGNSSLPCMQTTSHRIKSVLPQLKRFDVGMQHAKNYMWTYFDENRDLGLEGRFEYTPNNESVIPSTWYKSLSYSMGSLRDIIFQSSVNMEGLTQEMILEQLSDYLNIETPETIQREDEVFGRGQRGMSHLHPRTADDLRFTTFMKTFYKSSYYYFDSSNLISAWREVSEYFNAYLKKSGSNYAGHLVKLMLPSSYQTTAFAKTLPYPVQFQMRHPIILSLNIRTADSARQQLSFKKFDLHIRPSVYLTKLYTHQITNLGDCKEIGVYHEQKIAVTYPFEIKYDGITFPNITLKYKIPEKSKQILRYHSAAGTYAGQRDLQTLPSTANGQEIRRIPKPFQFEKTIDFVGAPPAHIELTTEDTNIFAIKTSYHDISRNPSEALDMAVKRILNAGWRHQSISVKTVEDRSRWTGNTETTFKFEYSRQHAVKSESYNPQDDNSDNQDDDSDKGWGWWSSQSERKSQEQRQRQPNHPRSQSWSKNARYSEDEQNEEDWRHYLEPVDQETTTAFTENARALASILNDARPHMRHLWNVSVSTEPLQSAAYLSIELNHTYDKSLYSVHADAYAAHPEEEPVYEISMDHLAGYWNRPDEFQYDNRYGSQKAGFMSAVSWSEGSSQNSPWEKIDVAVRSYLNYESNKEILQEELEDKIEDDYFLPETHEQCQKDVRNGKPLSEECVKAIREQSIYNKLNMKIMWDEELSSPLRQFARQADIYLKHHLYEYMNMTEDKNSPKMLQINLDYIDKLVDEAVVDIEFRKPTETFTLRRIPAGYWQTLSSLYSLQDNIILDITNNSYPPTCALMENFVSTYDLKTYEFQPKDCQYVLSAHCTEKKNFAVIVDGRKEIHVHLGSNTIILASKSGDSYQVKYNGEEQDISEPALLDDQQEIYVYPQNYSTGHQHIKVVARRAGVTVEYDGKNVKVQVSQRYKGQLCGLCSEFDGEELREFRGLDRCLYQNHVDFANSNMVQRDERCRVESLRGEKICDDETGASWKPDARHRNNEPSIQRNVVITKGNEVCFSVETVPVCRGDEEPSETKRQRLGFHCLPKNDATARKLMNEAKRRRLDEVERKSVDYVKSVEVAKMC